MGIVDETVNKIYIDSEDALMIGFPTKNADIFKNPLYHQMDAFLSTYFNSSLILSVDPLFGKITKHNYAFQDLETDPKNMSLIVCTKSERLENLAYLLSDNDPNISVNSGKTSIIPFGSLYKTYLDAIIIADNMNAYNINSYLEVLFNLNDETLKYKPDYTNEYYFKHKLGTVLPYAYEYDKFSYMKQTKQTSIKSIMNSIDYFKIPVEQTNLGEDDGIGIYQQEIDEQDIISDQGPIDGIGETLY